MKFEFPITNEVNIAAWNISNEKLEQDLHELSTTKISEEEVTAYLRDMILALKPVDNECCDGMLFLMYDSPSSMPADARVEYVYKPTYYAATIFMTAMNRFERIAENDIFQKTTCNVLNATMGRNFLGVGYNEYDGLINTLRIFALGETVVFLEKFPKLNERFACKFEEALSFLETEICAGNVTHVWSGENYSDKGNEVLAMFQSNIIDNVCGREQILDKVDSLPNETQEETINAYESESEGNRRFVFASRIERSSRNRMEAIRLHGYKCQVCGFDFVQFYGELGQNYIEVHHINPLAEQDGEQPVNPETDLVCLCANCHRMIHRSRHSVLSVNELRNIINS